MELETLRDLYIHELKDLHSAEKQLTKALPRMAKAATNEDLAAGFEEHLAQTEEHVNRLEKILESHDESTRGPKCKGMEGLIEEGKEMIEEDGDDDVRDAGFLSRPHNVLSIMKSPATAVRARMPKFLATGTAPIFWKRRLRKKLQRIRN